MEKDQAHTKQMVSLQLFGQATLETRHGNLSRFPSRRCASLFCLLALHAGRWVSRARIREALWTGRDATVANHCLDTELWRLSRALVELQLKAEPTPQLLSRSPGNVGLCMDIDFRNDVHDFEQTHRRICQSRTSGTLPLPGSHELQRFGLEFASGVQDDWCWLERERLRGAFNDMVGALIQHAERRQQWQLVLDYGHQLLEQDPLFEPVHRAMFRAQAALGNRAAALRQFQQLSRRLQRELHISPTPQTLTVIRSITASDGSLEPQRTDTGQDTERPARPPEPAEQLISRALDHIAAAEKLLAAVNRRTPNC